MIAAIIITLICCFSVLAGYLSFHAGYTKTADHYFTAGSSLGHFVLIFSLLASFMSAFAMFGMASLGYRTGFGSMFVLTVNLIPLGFLWYYIHKKTYVLGKVRKWQSMGAPFGERYGTEMRVLVPLVTILASIPYLVAQLQGIGMILETMTEGLISYRLGIFFVPIFIAVYLMMGGMKGAAWANTVQGLIFSLMIFMLFFVVMAKHGGFLSTMDLVFKEHPNMFQLGWADGKVWSYSMVFGFAVAMCIGCVCFPQPYMHAYASSSVKGFKLMSVSFGVLATILIMGTIIIGIVAKIIVPSLEGIQPDKVYGMVASELLPTWLAAMAVSGGFTAAMSTVNGLVFGNAMNISNDLYKLIRPSASSKELIRIARFSVALILVISAFIAWNPTTPVAELSVIAFGIVSVTFFPLWGAYYWRRATRWGAIASIVVGVGLNFIFFFIGGKKMILFPSPTLFNMNGFLVTFIATSVVFFGISLLTKPCEIEKKYMNSFLTKI